MHPQTMCALGIEVSFQLMVSDAMVRVADLPWLEKFSSSTTTDNRQPTTDNRCLTGRYNITIPTVVLIVGSQKSLRWFANANSSHEFTVRFIFTRGWYLLRIEGQTTINFQVITIIRSIQYILTKFRITFFIEKPTAQRPNYEEQPMYVCKYDNISMYLLLTKQVRIIAQPAT